MFYVFLICSIIVCVLYIGTMFSRSHKDREAWFFAMIYFGFTGTWSLLMVYNYP